MIVNIFSLMLSFVSVLQNVSKKKNLKEKVNELKNSLNQIDDLYKILIDSKTYHHNFTEFDVTGLVTIRELIDNNRNKTQNEIIYQLKKFLKYEKMFIKFSTPTINLDTTKPDPGDLSMLPIYIQSNISELNNKYPLLRNELDTYKYNIDILKGIKKSKNFGNNFSKCMILIESSSTSIIVMADAIIIEIAPIIDYIHSQMKSTLMSL